MKHIKRYLILGILGILTLNYVSAQTREEKDKSEVRSKPASPDVIYVKGVPAVKIIRHGSKSKELKREGLEVYPAYPNPFNKEISINYSIPGDEQVNIQIMDINGQLVRALTGGGCRGSQSTIWDGLNDKGGETKSGVYRCVIQYNNMKKISVIMKE